MLAEFDRQLTDTLEQIKSQGLYKTERVITSPQNAHIATADGKRVLNMCANNYLGLADHPALIAAAKDALDEAGMSRATFFRLFAEAKISGAIESAKDHKWKRK